MKRIDDHYFAAWLVKVKHLDYEIVTGDTAVQGKFKLVLVNITNRDYYNFLKEYENTLKDVFQQVRRFVKELSL